MEETNEPELKQIQFKIPEEQYNKLQQYATKNAFTLATVVRIAVKNFLDKLPTN